MVNLCNKEDVNINTMCNKEGVIDNAIRNKDDVVNTLHLVSITLNIFCICNSTFCNTSLY